MLPRISASRNCESKEEPYPVQLCIELALESAVLWWPAVHVAGIGEQRTIFHREIGPADDAIAPEERQRIVTELSFGCRRIGFETVGPVPQQFETASVMHDRIERR